MQGAGLMNHLQPMGEYGDVDVLDPKAYREELLRNELIRSQCEDLKGLSRGQTQLCQLYKEHMPYIGIGAAEAIDECQFQFAKNRWNCSVVPDTTVFGPLLNKGKFYVSGSFLEASRTFAILAKSARRRSTQRRAAMHSNKIDVGVAIVAPKLICFAASLLRRSLGRRDPL